MSPNSDTEEDLIEDPDSNFCDIFKSNVKSMENAPTRSKMNNVITIPITKQNSIGTKNEILTDSEKQRQSKNTNSNDQNLDINIGNNLGDKKYDKKGKKRKCTSEKLPDLSENSENEPTSDSKKAKLDSPSFHTESVVESPRLYRPTGEISN